ncbi:MAG TPA: ATPase, T2SS/T4P/T4SS family, partial [Azospirillaceae bacterium]|nr:ATPase, T2SS/T4P/T4SS family [Azospirillaceae bacterium]
DIIMVGEIRDAETAEMAIQSALTGHLVLSTLHTNDAASSITRLLDMGVEGYLLTTTINAVAAQRLVRCLCPQCREPYRLTPDMARPLGLIRLAEESEPVLYRAKGCPACHGTGYFGRVGILEILVLTDALRPLILAQADAGTIADAARRDGMRSLVETGMAKALAGVTSLEEILRVARPVS